MPAIARDFCKFLENSHFNAIWMSFRMIVEPFQRTNSFGSLMTELSYLISLFSLGQAQNKFNEILLEIGFIENIRTTVTQTFATIPFINEFYSLFGGR